ncbi:ATP-binding cassette sub-family B member 5 [Lemmus lemmus]
MGSVYWAIPPKNIGHVHDILAFGVDLVTLCFVFVRYTQNLKDAMHTGIKKAVVSKLSIGAIYFFMNGAYGLAFWYGTSLIFSGEPGYSIGTILAVSLLCKQR